MTKSTEAHKATNRPERKPLHRNRALEGKKIPGFYTRWVNEEIGAVDAYLAAGYTFVTEDGADVSDNLAQDSSHSGSVIRRNVNKDPNASAKTAVYMKLPLEFYKEDQAEKAKLRAQDEEAWNPKKNNDPSIYGDLTTTKSAVFNRQG